MDLRATKLLAKRGNRTYPIHIAYTGGAMAAFRAAGTLRERLQGCTSWPERFEQREWHVYKNVLREARRQELPFAVGGGLVAMAYAGQWRNTKDLDIYLRKSDCQRMIGILEKEGLRDYYHQHPYDRKWIFRSYTEETIIDLIWAMANQRAQVDEGWLQGPEVEAGGERFRLLAPEYLLWSKLYVLQRDRTDWPDSLNLLYGIGAEVDWKLLLRNLGDDAPLLGSLLNTFSWLCPERARGLPEWLWHETKLSVPAGEDDPEMVRYRASLLDSRPWFTPTLEEQGQRQL